MLLSLLMVLVGLALLLVDCVRDWRAEPDGPLVPSRGGGPLA